MEKESFNKNDLDSALERSPGLDIQRIIHENKSSVDPSLKALTQDFEDLDFLVKSDRAKKSSEITPKNPSFQAKKSTKKHSKFTAEKIRDRIGSIESIRRSLGLSKKALADKLLVDPSSMNRWCKGEAEAPPYIYRALDWYLSLIEKHPVFRDSLWEKNKDILSQLKEEDLEQLADVLGERLNLHKKQSSPYLYFGFGAFFGALLFLILVSIIYS